MIANIDQQITPYYVEELGYVIFTVFQFYFATYNI
jgi:hypothetical protein